MSETRSTGAVSSTAPSQSSPSVQQTAWIGWIVFAAIMMLFVGSFHVIQGLVALFNDEYYLVGKSGLAVQVDYTVWGWTHLIAGILVMCTGVGLLAGQRWARVVAVILVLVSMLLNFGFMAAYPFWSAIVIALDVVVIVALTVHGRELETL